MTIVTTMAVIWLAILAFVIWQVAYSIYLWGYGNGMNKCHRMWLDNLEAAERNLATEDNDA